VLHIRDLEAFSLDRIERAAVAVAARDQPDQTVQAVLPAGKARLVRANVLDEDQPAAGTEDPPELTQRPRLIIHSAEHERRDGDVERVVLEWEILDRRFDGSGSVIVSDSTSGP